MDTLTHRYIVARPVDRRQPGTDVTALYPDATLDRLHREGLLTLQYQNEEGNWADWKDPVDEAGDGEGDE